MSCTFKYKVGQRIRVHKDFQHGKSYNIGTDACMDEYVGGIYTITKQYESFTGYPTYYIKDVENEDSYVLDWAWSEDMLSPLLVEQVGGKLL